MKASAMLFFAALFASCASSGEGEIAVQLSRNARVGEPSTLKVTKQKRETAMVNNNDGKDGLEFKFKVLLNGVYSTIEATSKSVNTDCRRKTANVQQEGLS